MLEKFKYINHKNEVLEFGSGSLFANENDLRDFEWSLISRSEKISGFKKGIAKKSIPLIIKCNSEDEGINLRNQIYEITEKDILAKKPGKIVIGDYYLRCYITGITKSDYLISKQYMTAEMNIQTDSDVWINEKTILFRGANADNGFLDFPYDMPFDYRSSLQSDSFNNPGFSPCDFRCIIYGTVINPTIFINDHEYSVNVVVNKGEYLTIDSVNKTIYLKKINGEDVNCFNNRNKDSYIFQKVQPGGNLLKTSNEGMNFDLMLYNERSEPKWI